MLLTAGIQPALSAVAPFLADDSFGDAVGGLITLAIIVIILIASVMDAAKKKKEEELRKAKRAAAAQDDEDDDQAGWELVRDTPAGATSAIMERDTRAAGEARQRDREREERQRRFDDAQRRVRELQQQAREASPGRVRTPVAEGTSAQPGERRRPAGGLVLRRLRGRELASAIVYAEILGPPVALRDQPGIRDEDTPHRLV